MGRVLVTHFTRSPCEACDFLEELGLSLLRPAGEDAGAPGDTLHVPILHNGEFLCLASAAPNKPIENNSASLLA